MVLRVYVDKKKPLSELTFPVPRTIRLKSGVDIETDVVEIGRLQPHSPVPRLLPGASVGHPNITAGTNGCVVRYGSSDMPHLLSNFHVLGDDGAAALGDPVLQPGPADGGRYPGSAVGVLVAAVPYNFDGTPCPVDAAVAVLNDGVSFANDWLRFGNAIQPNGQVRDPQKGEIVHKIGRTSGFTLGKVLDEFGATLQVDHKKPGGSDRRPVVFSEQVVCSKYADPGDSGSVLFTADGAIVGLHMSGNDQFSVFNKMLHVTKALDVWPWPSAATPPI
jgi:hypothetical protein